MKDRIRVLIADDSAFMRQELKKIMERDPDIEVIAVVRDGAEAVERTRALDPDVVALDINMPIMDGLTALQYIMMESPRPVVMISSLTQEGALTTYEALELGAVDFVGKPGGTISKDIAKVGDEIVYKIRSAARANTSNLRLRRTRRRRDQIKAPSLSKPHAKLSEKVVVIGQSTGGPNTIMDIIQVLPPDLGVPVIVVQHMPSSFTPSFAQRLDRNCAFTFKEAKSGDIIEPNRGYLAPGDIHMTLAPRGIMKKKGTLVRLTRTPRNTLHTPSVDVTMESVLSCYGTNTIGVLLTGMGADGATAMVKIREAGGRTIAESEETAVVFGMPKEAIRRGGAEFVLPSYKIGEKIVELVNS
ncbi:MAG: chemotaxis response regulator protein-glutamate methylesterase [Deltaproteobacteria bacterium]|nr:MAG: chemotaxis response regulator protein-glutamate methylesterase [Deltaproteobacteria bacterium]